MKLTIERADLVRTLAHVQGVVERRNTMPILGNVKLDAAGGELSVTATDMDISVIDRTAADISTEGSLTVPALTLYDIVRKVPETVPTTLETSEDGTELVIRAGRSRFRLPILPAADFPNISDEGMTHSFSMKAADLALLIDRTRFAISTEETRYYLNGIFLHAVGEGATSMIRAVATDGHRLARIDLPLPDGAAGMPGVIVPRKTIQEVRKLLDEANEDVTIRLSANRVLVELGGAVLRSRLIDGTFPDYDRVIPKSNDKILTIETKAFKDGVDRISTIATDRSKAVKLNVEGDELTMSAGTHDTGHAEEKINCTPQNESLTIGFNAKYVLDMMSQLTGDSFELAVSDSTAPTVYRDPEDSRAIFVLMPMRV